MMSLSARQALITAERLLNAEDVLATAPAGGTLNGLAGTALLHARLATLDPAYANAAVRHWTAAASATTRSSPWGIYSSPGGLAASLIIGASYLPDPDTHRAATTRAARWLSTRAVELAECHRDHLNTGDIGTPHGAYDAITGLAGIGRILLAAVSSGHDEAEPGLLAALTFLTAMIHTRYGTRPGWWLSAAAHPQGARVHPSGTANTGMAHGIAGPLALLSVARMAGWTVTGQDAAIRDAADWLLRWRTNSVWPPHITGDELDTGVPSPVPGRADAWCYGIPGISRSLTLAGQATGDSRFTEAAHTALASLAHRPVEDWDVAGPTLCHGYAGVLRLAAESQSGVAERAAAAVTASFNPAHRFAFQHHHDSARDQPGFLTGAAGVALTLADHGRLPAPAVPARWDALLLLA